MLLYFVTGNAEKFAVARSACASHDVQLEQIVADIDEIQGEDPEHIVRDKVNKAFELVGKPVVITDDSWYIAGLNGFPGAYMKSVSSWLTAQHFMNLMQGIEDRTVTLSQYLAYQDEHETVVFQHDHIGRIVQKPRGKHKVPWLNVVAMEADNGKTLAEAAAAGDLDDPERLAKTGDAWHAFLDWIKQPRVNES